MTSIKKLVAVGATVLSMAAMTISAFAATTKAELVGMIPQKYQSTAQPYIDALPESKYDNAAAAINEAKADSTVTSILNSVSSVDELSASQITSLAARANDIAVKNDMPVKVDATTGVATVNGKAINPPQAVKETLAKASDKKDEGIIKPTGVNAYVSVAVLSVLGLALVGCGVVASKKRA